jgi:hypothetical protein
MHQAIFVSLMAIFTDPETGLGIEVPRSTPCVYKPATPLPEGCAEVRKEVTANPLLWVFASDVQNERVFTVVKNPKEHAGLMSKESVGELIAGLTSTLPARRPWELILEKGLPVVRLTTAPPDGMQADAEFAGIPAGDSMIVLCAMAKTTGAAEVMREALAGIVVPRALVDVDAHFGEPTSHAFQIGLLIGFALAISIGVLGTIRVRAKPGGPPRAPTGL